MSHADSLDILVLLVLTMPRVAIQGEWFFSTVLVGGLRCCMLIAQLSDEQYYRVRLCTTGYSLFITFNCACTCTTLHEL